MKVNTRKALHLTKMEAEKREKQKSMERNKWFAKKKNEVKRLNALKKAKA